MSSLDGRKSSGDDHSAEGEVTTIRFQLHVARRYPGVMTTRRVIGYALRSPPSRGRQKKNVADQLSGDPVGYICVGAQVLEWVSRSTKPTRSKGTPTTSVSRKRVFPMLARLGFPNSRAPCSQSSLARGGHRQFL